MAARTKPSMTVEEYSTIPDLPGGRYELHHGDLVLMAPQKLQHTIVQERLLHRLLSRRTPGFRVIKELAFRPTSDYEVWVCDLGILAEARLKGGPEDDWLAGSPDIVIEVLSSSNTAQEMNDREKTCFEGGCKQFWAVDPKLRSVRVGTPDGRSLTYAGEATIELRPYAESLRVNEIFAD